MGQLRSDPTIVAPGGTTNASASGYRPKTRSRLELAGRRTNEVRTTSTGSLSHSSPAAPDAEGDYQLRLEQRVGGTWVAQDGTALVQVRKPAPTPDPTPDPGPTPPPPSGDLPPPPAGTDAGALISATLLQRNVRLQNGATYVTRTPINRPVGRTLDLNGATVLQTFLGDCVRCAGGPGVVGGGTLQGAFTGGSGAWADSNHGVNVMGGGGHEFPDLWIRDMQGDAYYLQPGWPGGIPTNGNGVRITGGGFHHVGRMGIGVVGFDGGYVADWLADDSYRPIDFEPDPNSYSQTARHWLVERVHVTGYIRGKDGTGTGWLNFGSPQRQSAPAYQAIEDIEVRYCDVDNDRDYPHWAIATDNDGAHYRAKDLRVHHNTHRRRWGGGALFEHVDGVLCTDNTGVAPAPWARLNDCKDPITVARNG